LSIEYSTSHQTCADTSAAHAPAISSTPSFMTLYELDWDGNDFISTLSIDNCCTAFPSCNAYSCGGATTPWQGTSGYSGAEIEAEVRMRMIYATFRDPNGDCAFWAQWDPRYNCS
jgi:hypothetical protein